jgi:hypothetical protein
VELPEFKRSRVLQLLLGICRTWGPGEAPAGFRRKEEKVSPLLVPCSDGVLAAHAVSSRVNGARSQGPRCIEPIGAGGKADILRVRRTALRPVLLIAI